jgi:deoxyribonuclease-4
MLAATVAAAAHIGASGVVVHGGHVTDPSPSFSDGCDRWRSALSSFDSHVPVLVENTAGGDHAMTRSLADIERLWDVIGSFNVGVCLDTCHAWAAGIRFDTLVDRLTAVTGRIGLVHANDSRDSFDSGRDRHANLGEGMIPSDALAAVLRTANAPIVVETPHGAQSQMTDMEWIRSVL